MGHGATERDRNRSRDGAGKEGTEPTTVVFATDIGTDVDDTWALAQVVRAPDLDLRLVLTETGDPTYRASVAAKLLERAGRTDVPVACGIEKPDMAGTEQTQGAWVADYALADYPGTVHDDGIDAVLNLVTAAERPVTVVAVAPTPSLAAAVERDRDLAEHCRFVGMHGSFRRGYDGGEPDAEHNVRADPISFRTVLSAPWQDILLAPLDTCGSVQVTGERYHRLWSATDDPLLRGVIENTCLFAANATWLSDDDVTRRSSTLFDTVAVALARDKHWFEIERRSFDVTDDGFTMPASDGDFAARVALEWSDYEGFEERLVDVLLDR